MLIYTEGSIQSVYSQKHWEKDCFKEWLFDFFLNKFTVEHTVASDAFNIMCLTVKIPQDKNVNRLFKNPKQKKTIWVCFQR